MDPVLAGGLFGVGGVILGAVLNDRSAKGGRKQAREEQRADEKRARETTVAEKLDEALVAVSVRVDFASTDKLAKAFASARVEWESGWVVYSPRISQKEIRDRYAAVGSILDEYALGEVPMNGIAKRTVQRAVGNARGTLAHFVRGDPLPDPAFPDGEELVRLLGEGDGTDAPMGPLQAWLKTHPWPTFHPVVHEDRRGNWTHCNRPDYTGKRSGGRPVVAGYTGLDNTGPALSMGLIIGRSLVRVQAGP